MKRQRNVLALDSSCLNPQVRASLGWTRSDSLNPFCFPKVTPTSEDGNARRLGIDMEIFKSTNHMESNCNKTPNLCMWFTNKITATGAGMYQTKCSTFEYKDKKLSKV